MNTSEARRLRLCCQHKGAGGGDSSGSGSPRLPGKAAHRAPHTPHTHAPTGPGQPGEPQTSGPAPNPRGGTRGGSARTQSHAHTDTREPPRPPQLRGRDTLTCDAGLGHPLHDRLHGAAQRGRRQAGTAAAPGSGGRSPRPARSAPRRTGGAGAAPHRRSGGATGEGQVRTDRCSAFLLVPMGTWGCLPKGEYARKQGGIRYWNSYRDTAGCL